MATDIQTIRHLQQENIRLRSENNSLKKYVERLQRALRALSSLQHSISQIDHTTNAYNLVNQVLQYALDAVDSENGSLALLDEEKGDLVFVTVIGETRQKLLNYRLPKGQGVSHWAIKTQKTILVEADEGVLKPALDKRQSFPDWPVPDVVKRNGPILNCVLQEDGHGV